MKYIRLPAPIPTTPPTVAIELIEHYADPGVLEQIRFYPCIERMAPDPAWERPVVENPEYDPDDEQRSTLDEFIPDETAEHPQTMQYFRHPMLAGPGKLPEVRRVEGDRLAAFYASLATAPPREDGRTVLELDDEGVDPITRALLKFVWADEQAELAAILGS